MLDLDRSGITPQRTEGSCGMRAGSDACPVFPKAFLDCTQRSGVIQPVLPTLHLQRYSSGPLVSTRSLVRILRFFVY